MAFHWQSKTANTTVGVEDMVLLSKVTESQIVDNLNRRYMADHIYTYIGPVLISVNPYKSLTCFTQKEINIYHGSAAHEHPPHIYALAETMFQNMLIDEESQCVIISGESGAGKTESSKLLMNYISAVSGKGGSAIEETKRIILESNPLLEAFGNAKTLRNNNSSRFGKYFEIRFTRSGQPVGGHISNFLLEKSRIAFVKKGERNFHIFYQLCRGSSEQEKRSYGLSKIDAFNYLRQSQTYDAEGIDDVSDFAEVKTAMSVCGLSQQDQLNLFSIVAGILHLGNIVFVERGNRAEITNDAFLDFPAHLLGIDKSMLKQKLTSRLMTGGSRNSVISVNLNVQQATNTRDAFAKSLYSRIFDWIIDAVNRAIVTKEKAHDTLLSLGVLDIYGFEIFEKNGFEQLCINYVNEKLQQVFIELTLKSEQEEYVKEGIKWTQIEYFNNKIVVDLIEAKRPIGIFAVLDDICVQLHAVTDGVDERFVQKLAQTVGSHPHFSNQSAHFVVKHYAGQVSYDSDGFCEANKDTLFRDLILLAQSSSNSFIRNLYQESVEVTDKKRPTTAAFKIRNQSQELVTTLMKCVPSYIRCIKPNERKRSRDWDSSRVEHQVKYLNLRENINVRRAGFCYRNLFEKFMKRYSILTDQTFKGWRGSASDGVAYIMQYVGIERNQWQAGKTKVFIKHPESLFLLEELRERKYHEIAVKIQRAYRLYKSRKFYLECKQKTLSLFLGKKERKRLSLNRDFSGDYLNILSNPELRFIIGSDEKVLFCDKVTKYDRRWKTQSRELVITANEIIVIATEPIKQGPEKGKLQKVAKRRLEISKIVSVSLSSKCDDFFVIHVANDFDSVFENIFKTELITVIHACYSRLTGQALLLIFVDDIQYSVKKTSWSNATSRRIIFRYDPAVKMPTILSNSTGKTEIGVPTGLAKDSQSSSLGKQILPSRSHVVEKSNLKRHLSSNVSLAVASPPPAYPAPAPPNNATQSFSQSKQLNSGLVKNLANKINDVPVSKSIKTAGVVRSNSSRSISSRSNESTGIVQAAIKSTFSNPSSKVTHISKKSDSLTSINSVSRPAPPPPKPKLGQCKALYDYRGIFGKIFLFI